MRFLTKTPYNSSISKRLFDSFEDYINKGHESFIYFLFDLYGRHVNDDQKQVAHAIEDSLMKYCESEPDINMLTLAFFIFSQHLGRKLMRARSWHTSSDEQYFLCQ